MTPGLTCHLCAGPLREGLARRTDDGWRHLPNQCLCAIEGCPNRRIGKGYCHGHYNRLRQHGHPLGGVRIHLEDIEWMVQTGEGLSGALTRLGCKRNTLETHLRRAGRSDLFSELVARDSWRAA